ncbi:MAG: AMP-binding protein, partial [Lysobacterales bacterium]
MDSMTSSYFRGVNQPPLLEETIGQRFDDIAARFGERDALVVRHQGIRWTYAQFHREAERFASGLLALGVTTGDRVGIWAPNCHEWCLTQFATAKIGAILVCINPAYRVFELEYALNKSGCKAIVTAERFKSSDYLGMLRSLAPEL